jgi:hypothetical protein
MHGKEPARPETGLRAIAYSVRTEPPQPEHSFLSTASANPATIRIANPELKNRQDFDQTRDSKPNERR